MKKKEQKKNKEEKEKRKREIHRSLSFLFEKHAEISAANPVDWFHRVEMQKKKAENNFSPRRRSKLRDTWTMFLSCPIESPR